MEQYERIEIEVVVFETEDVITTSEAGEAGKDGNIYLPDY